jgi:hypothetical protein
MWFGCVTARCGLPVFVLPAFTHGAKATACATSGAIVVAQRPSMCRGYIVVAHCFASASRLRHVWVSLFLLVKGTPPRRTCAFIGLGRKFTKTQFAGNHIGVRWPKISMSIGCMFHPKSIGIQAIFYPKEMGIHPTRDQQILWCGRACPPPQNERHRHRGDGKVSAILQCGYVYWYMWLSMTFCICVGAPSFGMFQSGQWKQFLQLGPLSHVGTMLPIVEEGPQEWLRPSFDYHWSRRGRPFQCRPSQSAKGQQVLKGQS